jgi:nitroimidazol reductase NimA-like FMN-containing flavoprotein (pyridoxamine 5'-phosphate oxidase superfamily)
MRATQPLGEAKAIISDLFPLPASPQNLPLFRTLRPSQIDAILVRNSVGKIAFAVDGRVELLPINFVYLNGWIYGRTAAATFLPGSAPVTFQVDERTEAGEWRSVVVTGQLDLVESESPAPRGIYQRVLSRIRGLVRPAPPEEPAVRFRDQLFAIQAAEMSGRASFCRSKAGFSLRSRARRE